MFIEDKDPIAYPAMVLASSNIYSNIELSINI